MFSTKTFAIAGFIAAATMFSSAPSQAMSLSVGASTSRLSADASAIMSVQYRRVRPARVVRGPGVRGPVIRRSGVGRGVAIGLGAAAAVGVAGAVAAANRPRYYSEGYAYPAASPVYVQPACRVRGEELYNRNGVYRGVFQVRVCD